ncbi:hypothetical protein BH24DEI2_BH24DEI2_10090 [soil metagenome]
MSHVIKAVVKAPLAASPAALGVVVTHYRTPELLLECLQNLTLHAPSASVLVVDTGGEAAASTQAKQAFPAVRFIEAVNHSLANAVNTGLKQTDASFVLQMNADVMLAAGVVEAMLARFDDEAVGMVGPRCRTPTGAWQNQGLFYRPYYVCLGLSGRPAVQVPWLSGCCQLLRREALDRTGGMNSSLRFYNEDVEWSWRLRRAGYRCELVREAVLHVGGASTPADDRFLLEGLRGGAALSRQYKSKPYRSLHALGVLGFAAWQSRRRTGGNAPDDKTVYKNVARMFRTEQFNESPFGPTLNDANPAFLREEAET